jgi:hypothetical protein
MKHARAIALVFAAAGAAGAVAAASAAGRHSARPSAENCGGQLWHLKTLSDRSRRRVELSPQSTTVGAILARRGPGRPPTRRTTKFQLNTWEVPAQITAYRIDPTGSLRLLLFDHGAYLNAVIPSPGCLTSATRDRAAITEAWHTFTTRCGKARRDWQSLGAIVFVRGVGFWSQGQELRGAASNGAELHPVTGLRIVAGCRS